MFVTAISLKYALLASRWSYGHFLKLIEFYLNNTINFRHLTQRIIQCYTHKMALVSWPQTPWRRFTLSIKLPARCGWRNNYRFLRFRVVYVCIYIIRGGGNTGWSPTMFTCKTCNVQLLKQPVWHRPASLVNRRVCTCTEWLPTDRAGDCTRRTTSCHVSWRLGDWGRWAATSWTLCSALVCVSNSQSPPSTTRSPRANH